METAKPLTAKNIAKLLGVPDGRIKKAIAELKLAPSQKHGACSYYGADAVARIKSAIQ